MRVIITRAITKLKQKIYKHVETRFKETDCSSFILISLFLFLDDFDLYFYIFEKNKKIGEAYITFILYILIFYIFCVKKK